MGKVTLQDIADAVGVSRMTVSNAFNRPNKLSESLRETILQTANAARLRRPGPERPSAGTRPVRHRRAAADRHLG